MARKEKKESTGASQAYLISFGDTMTALLAFFIVMNSLADEQTGANLHAGTGSFVTAVESFGLPGLFSSKTAARAVQLRELGPSYLAEDPESGDPERHPSGPDAVDNGLRVMDRELEQFTRFVNELEHMFAIESESSSQGEVVFDYFNRLNPEPPHLSRAYRSAFSQVVPLLKQDRYRVQIIVWATTPGDVAWRRATLLAAAVRNEIAQAGRLNAQERHRLSAQGKPWLFSDVKRPILSIVVLKLES